MKPDDIYFLLVLLPPLLLSLTVHEYAHARTALAFGDDTAKMMGRVSLNPLRHLDPVGTLVLIFTRAFGWAKPVPVNPHNLHPRRLADAMVSLAGPLSNLMLAATAALAVRILLDRGLVSDSKSVCMLYRVLLTMVQINVGLAVFNLLPLYPLDGHHIAREMLPAEKQIPFMQWQLRHGWMVLIALLIGPRLIEGLLRREIFDPVSEAVGRLLLLTVDLFGIWRAVSLAYPH